MFIDIITSAIASGKAALLDTKRIPHMQYPRIPLHPQGLLTYPPAIQMPQEMHVSLNKS